MNEPQEFCPGWRRGCAQPAKWAVRWAYRGATKFPSQYYVCGACLDRVLAFLEGIRETHGRDAIVGQSTWPLW